MLTFREADFLPVEVPVGISNRHIHLCREDLDVLFGPGYELTVYRDLSQPGEYAARETVTIVGPRGVLEGVRVLGPVRSHSQVEISMTDGFHLGLKPPVRESGDLEGTPGIAVVGPAGALNLPRGVILAARHIHMEADRAAALHLQDDQRVQVLVPGIRELILSNVIVRVRTDFRLELHLDTDEANAALLANGSKVKILRP
ncbi:phosphate propanoyltransferase [Moorella sp. Hama-1]|uniref:phosphate propanoyltransferase n=1 Tax=Moorella sp. Hama-1 TaxID=2138101 RepID=UPI000D64C0E3|nr:phosphate propanoyltransferase [Moorella sp. Hama-1]MDN5361191.1 putative phosphotransacetylase [Moorella sp. (in: firmicutes)]BCV20907.1 phosphate propanoyltransferase [Moorella sp. Hama-1]